MKNSLGLLTFACFSHLVADIAYVANVTNNTVTVFDTVTNTAIGSPIAVGTEPFAVAITPDGSRAYVTNNISKTVSVIDTATNTVVTTITGFSANTDNIAISPNGKKAYVANFGAGTMSVVDLQSNTIVGSPIGVGGQPMGIVFSLDGSKVYVSNFAGTNYISVIDTDTDAIVNTIYLPFVGGISNTCVNASAITPDGRFIYSVVAGILGTGVTIVDTQTESFVGLIPTPTGFTPGGVIVSLDGSKVYVIDSAAAQVGVINTTTHLVETIITVPNQGFGIANALDGSAVYKTNLGSPGSVTAINTTTNMTFGSAVATNDNPIGIALKGMQPPRSVKVKQASNKYGVVTEYFNYLTWEQSPSLALAGYEIRRNGTLIKTLGPDALSYKDHNQSPSKRDIYTITAIDGTGLKSFPVTIVAQGD